MPIYSEPDEVMASDISIQIGDENISVTFGKPIPQSAAVKRAFEILGTFVHDDNPTVVTEDLVNYLTDIIQDCIPIAIGGRPGRATSERLAKEILQSKGFIKAIKNIKLV